MNFHIDFTGTFD